MKKDGVETYPFIFIFSSSPCNYPCHSHHPPAITLVNLVITPEITLVILIITPLTALLILVITPATNIVIFVITPDLFFLFPAFKESDKSDGRARGWMMIDDDDDHD